ncbi:MAG: hypothetical protein IJW63_07110 [Lachnospiraceae bacterium]|nr:hypothetical protein [Lachnospiraceae bacterium]
MKLKNKANWICAALALLWLLISLPLFLNYCMEGMELQYHLLRIEGLKEGLLSGQFPVRIQPNWMNGEGYPVSIFEGDTFLMLPVLFRVVGLSVQMAYRLMLAVLNVVAIWIAYSSFKGMFGDPAIGLIGSLLYVCAPYRLDALYAKADLGESIAICFLPMVLYGCFRLLTQNGTMPENKYTWLYITVGMSAVFQAHMTSFEIALFLFVLLCVAGWKKVFRRESICHLCKAAGAFLVLNAWLLIPLVDYLLHKDLRFKWGSSAIQSKGVYWLHYLTTFFVNGDSREFGQQRMAGTAALGIGFALTCLILVYAWMLFVGKYREARKTEPLWGFASKVAVVSAIVIWMSTQYFPWDLLRSESRIVQMLTVGLKSPAKFLPVATVGLSFLGCILLWQIKRAEPQKVFAFVMAAVIGLSMTTTEVLLVDYMENRSAQYIYEEEDLDTMQILDGDYLFLSPDANERNMHTDVNVWYWRVAEVMSAIGWIALGTGMVARAWRHCGKEDCYVEKI